MLPKFVWMLLLMHCSCAKSWAATITGGHTLADYATFGSLQAVGLNALEERALDTLCKFCMARDDPEVPETLASASARWVAPRDKARCVVMSVLCSKNPLASLNRLMARTGFACHCLLVKIFYGGYIKSLQSEITADPAMDDQFNKAIRKHSLKLGPVGEYINECVLATARMDFGEYVAQNADRDTGCDFGILGSKMLIYKCVGVVEEFSKQVELWLAGKSINKKLLSTACEFTRAVLHSRILVSAWATGYKSFIAEFVARSPHKELLVLFSACHDSSSIQARVTDILKNGGYHRIRPDFFLNYLKWLREFSDGVKTAVSVSWRRYLRDRYALLHVLQICEDPRSFMKEVPHLLLYNTFKLLHAVTDDISRRNEAVRVITKNLDYRVFTLILTKATQGKYHILMRFVLGCLDDDTRAAYFAAAKQLENGRSKNKTQKYKDVCRDIMEKLKSIMDAAPNIVEAPRAF
ncbi:hypothetical protein PAPHI01_2244 [Pancytospora philotis]|nr:hypothetical protein PAPHI01_2244 [Pancytospora philotis]